MNRRSDAPVRITTARSGRSVDIRSRQTRYLISMGIRTACFLLAIVTDGPLRWILIVSAFVLPYFAVVMANAGSRPDPGGPHPFTPTPLTALETSVVQPNRESRDDQR